jgi:hypothetical protein
MGVSEILATIDHEIAQLQQARALLSGGVAVVAKKKAGRPRKAVAVAAVAAIAAKPAKTKKKKKRNLSPEGRKRIAEAVKKRWAAQKAAIRNWADADSYSAVARFFLLLFRPKSRMKATGCSYPWLVSAQRLKVMLCWVCVDSCLASLKLHSPWRMR